MTRWENCPISQCDRTADQVTAQRWTFGLGRYRLLVFNRVLILVVEGILTAFAIALGIGHGPLAGDELLAVTSNHGLNSGDIPIMAAWVVATCFLITLWVRQ